MMECSICQSNNVKTKFRVADIHQLFQCLNCSTEFLSPQLTDEALDKLYSENYYNAWGLQGADDNEVTRGMKRNTFRLRLNLIKKHVHKGSILDVGCASGYFLEEAAAEGFDAYGVEISRYASSVAKNKFGENRIFHGKREDSRFQNENFDAITMSDLLEHVRNPIDTILKAKDLLKEKGIIMIMTPNTSSLSRRILGSRWTHYKPEHFFYFNPGAIAYMAEKCGLKVIYLKPGKKTLNLYYLHAQFNVYKHWLFTRSINALKAILPKSIINHSFYFNIGEMVILLQKQ